MFNTRIRIVLKLTIAVIVIHTLSSWGFFAHKLINRSAVFILPSEISLFYKRHIDWITEKAIDPDKRCYVDTLESPRHYIDIDEYESNPDSIPIHWTKATAKYQERTMLARGIVPWQIFNSYRFLVHAFENNDLKKILRHSADLGHYIADAHVPLHTTKNYNGQYSKQVGIHAFWESRLPEMFADRYNLFVGKATYIEDPLEYAWTIVKDSNRLTDSVLSIEKTLSQTTPKHLQRSYITRNNLLIYTYSDWYATQYHDKMNGMVERRLRASIRAVGNLWYTAWIDAGQPNLSKLMHKQDVATDSTAIPLGIIKGREEWH